MSRNLPTCRRRTARTAAPSGVAAAAFGFARDFGFGCPARERTSSSQAAASSSSMSFAYMSSEARIFFAFTNICFSPVERPFSLFRTARFRTTSASSKMLPVFILSRLCLKRRFQFFGISVEPPESVLTTIVHRALVDDRSQSHPLRVLAGHVDGHVVVEDLDRQVLPRLAREPRASPSSRLSPRRGADRRPCRRCRTRGPPRCRYPSPSRKSAGSVFPAGVRAHHSGFFTGD